jgi:hypothetical protein
MSHRLLLTAVLLTASGCSLGAYSGAPSDVRGPGDGGGTIPGDLPCDVASLLSAHCTGCHGSPPSGGAPMALDTFARLTGPSPLHAGQSNAQRSLLRMQDQTAPMPPSPAALVPAADIGAFASWVDAGTPTGSCAPAGDPAFTGPSRCTSNSFWTGGNNGSSQMHPGVACITCHSSGDGPAFAIAGTVYPSGHEPDDCNGSGASGAVVTVKDSNGTTRSFTANQAGNFSGSPGGGWPVLPITATVSFAGRTRDMATAVTSGDCNRCHTQSGSTGAPGRIALP